MALAGETEAIISVTPHQNRPFQQQIGVLCRVTAPEKLAARNLWRFVAIDGATYSNCSLKQRVICIYIYIVYILVIAKRFMWVFKRNSKSVLFFFAGVII